ncbi:glycosyltransferase family 4 protein [Autumnicola musiva]|uniref:Glycosyltransferase family 4 protein n=1 Tax=Autumnicola musiva TaxID=3075589 RepID=A0ABU3D5H0_9FLAO|nr:glycosyltransferase family 4 protein [Zunongwangia sp. F117]MDT0676783.1 glycosyltransferase family 4 protein [Zunongwangia sp. F117]
MKFGIITYILHKEGIDGKFYSYSPYISEMNIWMKLADETLIAAPKVSGTASAIETAYSEAGIDFYQIPTLNFTSLGNSFKSLLKMSSVILGILKVMRKADHIHLRCPGNISLIGCFLQIFFPKKPKTVKYAGNWDPKAVQPWSYKLQKKILGNTFISRNVKVLVYGKWPNQSANIVPFFTASFSELEKERINLIKEFQPPFQFLFVGSLVEGKRPGYVVELIEALHNKGIKIKLDIFGDGPLKNDLQKYISLQNLEHVISIRGSVEISELKHAYKKAHFVILPSKSEGWPKAVAEAMFFGCIPIATPVSCVPWMLDNGNRGILIGEELKPALAEIRNYLEDGERLEAVSKAAMQWSQQYTLEKLETELKNVLEG